MSLLNVESYVFINVFYLVLFCIHVCVDDVIKKKIRSSHPELFYEKLFMSMKKFRKRHVPHLKSDLNANIFPVSVEEFSK